MQQLTLFNLDPMPQERNRDWYTDCWQTPPLVLELVKRVFHGVIDLDRATDISNPTGAISFFTLEDNCLETEWVAKTCFLNPPYSKPLPFIRKLCDSLEKGTVKEAILLVRQGIGCNQGTGYWIGRYANGLCFWRSPRIAFVRDGIPIGGSHIDGNFYYFGHSVDWFREIFSLHGTTWKK